MASPTIDLEALKALYTVTDDAVNWLGDPWEAVTYVPALVAEVERLRAALAGTKVMLHLTEQERLNFRENIEWLRGELQIGKGAVINARAVAADRIADLNKICRDVMAERDEARADVRSIDEQCNRMRPVVDAARTWRRARIGSFRPADYALAEAVDALGQDDARRAAL